MYNGQQPAAPQTSPTSKINSAYGIKLGVSYRVSQRIHLQLVASKQWLGHQHPTINYNKGNRTIDNGMVDLWYRIFGMTLMF